MAALLYRLEELNKDHGDLVGKKCANLGELTNAGFRVPAGFALALEAYDAFLRDSGAGEEITRFLTGFEADPNDPGQIGRFGQAAEHIQAIIEPKVVPGAMGAAIVEAYDGLGGRLGIDEAAVAVRSAGPVSHPGQYDSFLNVRGREEVLRNVVKVWSSTFNARSLIARARKGLALDRDPIGVCVLEMVDARAAGVMFTAEPNTADVSKLMVEGSWGLGEKVVSGSVIPDVWMVDRTRFAVIDRRTAPSAGGGEPQACLTDEEVVELARIGARVEQHFGAPQDIEWAVAHGSGEDRYYLLQTRNEKFSIRFAGF